MSKICWARIRKYLPQALVVGVTILLVLVFVVWYAGSEKTVYFWDNSGYWMKTRWIADNLGPSTKMTLQNIVYSVRHDEYNFLFAVPLSLILMVFGGSRMTYILSVLVVYYLPAVFILSYYIHKVTKHLWPKFISGWQFVATFAIVALNPFLILPVTGGYPDVVGLIPLTLALIYYIRVRLNPRLLPLITIALLLALAPLLRRWYIFASAGMLLGIAIDQLIIIRPLLSKGAILRLVKLSLLPVVFGAVFITIAFPYITQQLIGVDYVEKYAAYKFHHNYFELAWICIRHYGIVYILASLIGLTLLVKQKSVAKGAWLVILVAHIFAFFLVGKIQTFDTHQYYLLTTGVLLGLVSLPLVLFTTAKQRYKKQLFWISYGLILIMYVISGISMYHQKVGSYLVSDVSANPVRRQDISVLKKLYNRVETTQDNLGGGVYVLACSFSFNVDLFRNIPLSTNDFSDTLSDNEFMPTAIFDVAQGFHTSFFDSTLVVDSSPVGYITTHKEEQQVIQTIHSALSKDGILSPYFKRLPGDYMLDGGYDVYVYVRKEIVPVNVRNELIMQIQKTHPGRVPIVDDAIEVNR